MSAEASLVSNVVPIQGSFFPGETFRGTWEVWCSICHVICSDVPLRLDLYREATATAPSPMTGGSAFVDAHNLDTRFVSVLCCKYVLVHDKQDSSPCDSSSQRSVVDSLQVAYPALPAAQTDIYVRDVRVDVTGTEYVDPKWVSSSYHGNEPVVHTSARVRRLTAQ